MNPVKFETVHHDFGSRKVLEDLSFTLMENRVTAMIGKSGSGKSTLLQMINGLIKPLSGCVRVFDTAIDYNNLPDLRLHIGYAVQGTGLFPHLTVFDNISLLARVRKMDRSEMADRIDHLMKLVDLDPGFLNKYPHQLSGGEQQRVGICRAMMMNPRIFLLDEAFGALDPGTRKEIHQHLLNLQQEEPRTIIMVTHDLHEAKKLADDVLVLDQGRLSQLGTVSTVFDHPANDYVANLIRSQQD